MIYAYYMKYPVRHDFHEDHGGPGDGAREHYGPCNDQGIMSYQPPQNLPRQWQSMIINDIQ